MGQSRRHGQVVLGLALGALGALAVGAGARGVLRGAQELAGPGPVPAVVDSENRFYAAWYLLTGVTLLRVASQPEPLDGRSASSVWGSGPQPQAGSSLRQTGRPSTGQLLLLGVELTLPPVLLPWQARVAQASAKSARGTTVAARHAL